MRLHAGATFAGYLIMDRLGRGGMATVYLAREPQIDRLVALKVLPEHLVDEGDFARRFEQEARVIAGLDHPNIIPLYRFGIDQDVPWMALRYVDGGDLAANLARYPLTSDAGLSVLRAIGAALDYAHSRNVIHRDLKPQNVLLTSGGAAYLADFGIAKLLEGSQALKTATGGIIGTPAYMAPEQAQGATPTPATDVYALAVMAFQWLTGSLPFDADTPQAVLLKHISEPVPTQALRSRSPAVATVLVRGLAKQPEQRYQSAGALVAELEDALNARMRQATGTTVTPNSVAPRAPLAAATAAGSSRRWEAVGLVVLVLVSAIGGYSYWRHVVQRATEDTLIAATEFDPQSPAQPKGRFVELGGDVLKDNQTGLEWTQSDNGTNIDWAAARDYCASRSNGWRLPNVDELVAIYDASHEMKTPCGSLTCYVSPLFHLTDWVAWSSEAKSPEEAFVVGLDKGVRGTSIVIDPFNERALCVRRP